jgi:uncharacterized protein YdhG (YjbR/CyaY superfamily)
VTERPSSVTLFVPDRSYRLGKPGGGPNGGCEENGNECQAAVRQEQDRQGVRGVLGRGTGCDEERARELKAEARADRDRAAGERDVLAKIAEMAEPDRSIAKRLHAIITARAPDLLPKTWYGMPAYAHEGKVVCFFQSGQKYNSRYSTFGFQDAASLDDGTMWPTSFALTKLTPADEKRIVALLKTAMS